MADKHTERGLRSAEVAAWLKDAPARLNDELHPDSRAKIEARLQQAADTQDEIPEGTPVCDYGDCMCPAVSLSEEANLCGEHSSVRECWQR